MRRRTRAREIAVQFLYQLDLRGEEVLEQISEFLQQETEDEEVRVFARRLIEGTREARDEADEQLKRVTRNWDLSRMAAMDRNILRMSVYEILHCADIPPKVTINEAIEIGKKYSTANSGAFINGILDRVRLETTTAAGSQGESLSQEA